MAPFNTVNFLATLTVHRHTVTQQLLFMTAPHGSNTATPLTQAFCTNIIGVGQTLNKKSENYEDPALSSLFLLNNFKLYCKGVGR
ncbi:hypothetical protein KIN20_005421 [Parelaphostrongylus tenuis]|uniref:Exocyst complex subunit Exo70 C-terminal domain-containing protein n=1 Tax=Parelaphostrongylus tenuis TaxID=148309 RepID=A0AAD5ML75_PARTN|nr:hypothetical protein KIN20_005421 [Parelaphostrongylus tenuis]